MFLENKTIIHLDLSHNGFKKAEIDIMGVGLKENHTILGLHMLGNEITTNSLGFVTVSGEENPAASHIISRIQPTLETGVITTRKAKLSSGSNCWICEGWTQLLYRFEPKVSIPYEID